MKLGSARNGIVSGCVASAPWCKNVAPPPPAPQPKPSPPPPPPGPVLPPLPLKPTREPNMNGKYQLSETATSNTSKYPDYRDYPGGVEYFDVYSPLIVQRYSQVYWKALAPAQLPADVVKKFDGRTMAVVGFEIDQVQNPTVPATGGSAKPGSEDLSVPINVVYNHHFESTMAGKAAKFVKVQLEEGETPQDRGGHGAPNTKETWIVQPVDAEKGMGAHGSTGFGGANGGEYRKSFHGYPPGTAQLLHSPTEFTITPMQIDTWNRDKMPAWNQTFAPKFVPGPVPRNNLAPTTGPDAIYSGLLECPLTTRVRKVIQANYKVQSSGPACSSDMGGIQTAAECFQAVEKLLPNVTTTTTTVSNGSVPTGCSIEREASGAIDAVFNKDASATATCGGSSASVSGTTKSLVQLHLSLEKASDEVRITMVGPSAVWYGVGFNASEMSDEPWAIIVDGSGAVTERKLLDQKAGTLLKTSVKVLSNTVSDGVRTVTMSRSMKGESSQYYSFDFSGPSLVPFINAVGSTPTFSYHKAKSPASLLLLPVAAPACVCSGSKLSFGDGSCKGGISYVPTGQKEDTGAGMVNFNNRCAPDPASQLLSQHNPTCDLRTYVGGQLSCHHMWSLLDADQEIPWVDRPLEYHFKFRFWYQEYRADGGNGKPSHKKIGGGWGSNLGAGGGGLGAEFDVPKCAEGVPGCSKGEDGTWVHTVVGIQKASEHAGSELVAAHMHCHAPTCLSMSIANNETGEMICEQRPTYGGSNPADVHDKNRPGTSREADKYEETGFIAVPPCLWGSPEHGLDPPPNLDGVTMRIVKRSNATYGHHGEMAHGQFYYAS